MNNFFEQELRKLFGDGEIIQAPKFVGRVCLGDLGGDLRVRAEFVTIGIANQYEALRLTVLKRTEGEVDRSHRWKCCPRSTDPSPTPGYCGIRARSKRS